MSARPRWRRVADALMLHLGIILAMYAGCLWLFSAHVRWNPAVYAPLRELAPAELQAARAALPAAATAVLLLCHLSVATAYVRGHLRALFLAVLTIFSWVSLGGIITGVVYLCRLAARLPVDEEALKDLREVRDGIRHLLAALEKYSQLPEKFNQVMQEVEASVPYVACAAAAAGGVLLLTLLGLAAAAPALLYAHFRDFCHSTSTRSSSAESLEEKKPLTPALSYPRLKHPRG